MNDRRASVSDRYPGLRMVSLRRPDEDMELWVWLPTPTSASLYVTVRTTIHGDLGVDYATTVPDGFLAAVRQQRVRDDPGIYAPFPGMTPAQSVGEWVRRRVSEGWTEEAPTPPPAG